MLIFSILLTSSSFVYSQYTPSLHTPMNKPVGMAQAAPTDARSYYYDATSYTYRPYNSTSEVLSYLNTSVKRSGHFPIYVLSGGIVKAYMFRNGVLDANLVEMSMFGSGTDSTMYSFDGTLTGNRTINLSSSTLNFTNGSGNSPFSIQKGAYIAASGVGNIGLNASTDTIFNYYDSSDLGSQFTSFTPKINFSGTTRFNGTSIFAPIKPDTANTGISSNILYFFGRGNSRVLQYGSINLEGYGGPTGGAFGFKTDGFFRFNSTTGLMQLGSWASLVYPTTSTGVFQLGVSSTTGGFLFGNGSYQTSGNLLNVYNDYNRSKFIIQPDGRTKFYSDTARNPNGAMTSLSTYAAFEIESRLGKGLIIPRMNTSTRTSLGTGAPKGLIVYDTSANNLYFYNGSAWVAAGGGTGGIVTTTYTPTFLTNVANVSASSLSGSLATYNNYNGTSVEVWGQITITPTATSTLTKLRMQIPISAGGSSAEILQGNMTTSDGLSGRIYYDNVTEGAMLEFTSNGTSAKVFSFRYIYRIVAL